MRLAWSALAVFLVAIPLASACGRDDVELDDDGDEGDAEPGPFCVPDASCDAPCCSPTD
jgi:hypothetical protein